MKIKLIVNNPQDVQEVIEITESGYYFDDSRVIWDERIDGKLPSEIESAVGALTRQGKIVSIDQVKLAKINADKADLESAKASSKKSKQDAKDFIKSLDFKSDLSAKDLQKAVKSLVSS